MDIGKLMMQDTCFQKGMSFFFLHKPRIELTQRLLNFFSILEGRIMFDNNLNLCFVTDKNRSVSYPDVTFLSNALHQLCMELFSQLDGNRGILSGKIAQCRQNNKIILYLFF